MRVGRFGAREEFLHTSRAAFVYIGLDFCGADVETGTNRGLRIFRPGWVKQLVAGHPAIKLIEVAHLATRKRTIPGRLGQVTAIIGRKLSRERLTAHRDTQGATPWAICRTGVFGFADKSLIHVAVPDTFDQSTSMIQYQQDVDLLPPNGKKRKP